jgi:hypothetical protein
VIPEGARAIALAPPTIAYDIPVRIEADGARRARLERAIELELPSVQFVDEQDFARFIVVLEGDTWWVMDAGGLRTTLSFSESDDERLAGQLVHLFSSSATATTLLALDNPAADIRLWLDVVKPRAAASGLVPSYRVRQAGEPRSEENSLILEIRSDADVFVTVVDIDTDGRVNLLFPNEHQRSAFLPNGFVPANAVVRIPDSWEGGNRAGFHWDYSPPAGKDNIRVFATTDLAIADTIRNLVREASDAPRALGNLRGVLLGTAVGGRGVQVVADTPAAEPSVPAGARRPDWTAASIVVEVRE